MTVTCPACDEELDVMGGKVLAVGDQVQCDECGEILEVSEMVDGGVSAVEQATTDDPDEEFEDEDEDDESDLNIDYGDPTDLDEDDLDDEDDY
jgi:hypothetical protein